MIRIKAITKLSPEEAIKRAGSYFGPGGIGLEVTEQKPSYISLQGGGGYVEASSSVELKGTAVEFVSQEWENQVKEFINTLKK